MAREPEVIVVRGDGVDLAVAVRDRPGAPTVVLVHGYPDTHALWDPVADRLHADGFRVVAHDVRGAGRSEGPVELDAYRLEHLVGDLSCVVDAASPEAPVHLVGHDWGSIQCWEAVLDPRLAGRVASFTSISGPPLDHVARWVRDRGREGHVLVLARQAVRSSYVGVFHVPGLAAAARRGQHLLGRARAGWARALGSDGARTDERWPAPTFGRDAATGMSLYRANVQGRLRRGGPPRSTAVPVQLVLPARDRFVPAWLFEGIEAVAPHLERVEIDAGHWVVRSHPDDVAERVAAHARAHPAAPPPSPAG